MSNLSNIKLYSECQSILAETRIRNGTLLNQAAQFFALSDAGMPVVINVGVMTLFSGNRSLYLKVT